MWNTFLRGNFSKFNLARHGVKTKKNILFKKQTNTVKGINQIIAKDINIIKENIKIQLQFFIKWS